MAPGACHYYLASTACVNANAIGSTLKLIKRQSICLPPFERATHTHVLVLSAPVNYARAATRSAPVTRRRSINARERALPANKNREKNDFTSGCMLWNLIVHAENVCRLGESRRQRRTYISLYTLYTQMHSRFMHPLKLDTFTLTIATRGCARINEHETWDCNLKTHELSRELCFSRFSNLMARAKFYLLVKDGYNFFVSEVGRYFAVLVI